MPARGSTGPRSAIRADFGAGSCYSSVSLALAIQAGPWLTDAPESELEARRHADLRRLNQAQRSLIRAVTLPSAISVIVRQLAEHLQAGDPGRTGTTSA
jgi:hypothetical protein